MEDVAVPVAALGGLESLAPAHLDGPEAPKAWQGALPLTYRLGGESA